MRSRREPPYCRWSKETGGDSAAVIQGSDRDVPLWSTSLESPKATRRSAKGYQALATLLRKVLRTSSAPQLRIPLAITSVIIAPQSPPCATNFVYPRRFMCGHSVDAGLRVFRMVSSLFQIYFDFSYKQAGKLEGCNVAKYCFKSTKDEHRRSSTGG